MSVRRLAEQQPESFAFTPENQSWAEKEITKYPPGRQASAIIALLWRAQKQNDYWLSKPAIEKVAAMLDMPFIRALEVATFYTMFNLEPVGRFHVQLCGTTPCVLRGAEAIKQVCHEKIGEPGHRTPDGAFSWIEVECLGACCNAPMVQINDDYFEDLTPENFGKLLDDLKAGREVKVGSQIGRISSEPAGGKLTALATLYGEDGKGIAPAEREAIPPANENAPAAEIAHHGAPAGAATEPTGEAAPAATAEAKAQAEEADIKAKLANLPKEASAEQKADAVGKRPPSIPTPPEGQGDDLQRIRGIGPVNARNLRELGVHSFSQIAAWSRVEIRWVGTYLSFPGRIDREQWVAQAQALTQGGASGEQPKVS